MKNELPKEDLLQILFATFCNGIRHAKAEKPKKWLESKGLKYENPSIGFNSGQFHHRRDEKFRNMYVRIGVLKKSDAAVRFPGMKAYTCFGDYGIIFPLKNEHGQTVNMYAIRIDRNPEVTEYLNDEGLYPAYPNPLTSRLYLTKNILDAATLLHCGVLENRDAVIALKDGKLTEQHFQAIKNLKNLEQIILINNE